jgi:uncharacterized protein YfiM (DUF2279 family)
MRTTLLFIALFFLFKMGLSQDSLNSLSQSPGFKQKRLVAGVGLQVSGYGASLFFLSKAWYKGYDQTAFHFFDDSREWLQIDKAGHGTACWYLGRMGMDMMEWSGVNRKKVILYGTAGSFLYLTGIEILDGFSAGWGFSWSDFAANSLGTGLVIGQKLISYSPNRHRIMDGISAASFKFSFHQTAFPPYRPTLLGNTFLENSLKDYNGQTYWLSFNISSFRITEHKFPGWLNLAFGYGGEGMISGNPGFVYSNMAGRTIEFKRYRQYYFSLDIDLAKIKTSSPLLKTIFTVFSFIKIPAPALEMSGGNIKFHALYL